MESTYFLRDFLQPHDWLGKIDSKDAQFVIILSRDHRKYLRFVCKQTLLESPSPPPPPSIMKPVVSLLRQAMIRLIIYLGDILLVNASETVGVRRIGLASFYPKVCPSNQSESDPIRSLKSQSD